jgi:hypothetical protein
MTRSDSGEAPWYLSGWAWSYQVEIWERHRKLDLLLTVESGSEGLHKQKVWRGSFFGAQTENAPITVSVEMLYAPQLRCATARQEATDQCRGEHGRGTCNFAHL